jgi:5'-3' exonuclease
MIFVNEGESKKIRLVDGFKFKWVKVKTGEKIDLPFEVGIKHNFKMEVEAIESKVNGVKVETKVIKPEDKKKDSYEKELQAIKGIGKKTAKDIVKVYPTKDLLIKAIEEEKHLPFRDDVVTKLKKKING